MKAATYRIALEYVTLHAKKFAVEAIRCFKEEASTVILSAIYLKLSEVIGDTSAPLFDIRGVQLGTAPVSLVGKDNFGRTREVTIWIDSAVGGPQPVIRLSKGGNGTATGGLKLAPGMAHELGKVPPDVELWAASDQPIQAYVLERA